MKIGRTYRFESAHRLPLLPENHKCHHLHGHNYRMVVEVVGDLDSRGFILDFAELDDVVMPLVRQVDHRYLNDVHGLENPTAELIARWFFNQISTALDRPCTVRIYETAECYAETGTVML